MRSIVNTRFNVGHEAVIPTQDGMMPVQVEDIRVIIKEAGVASIAYKVRGQNRNINEYLWISEEDLKKWNEQFVN
ncbi:hypothetical protein N781_04285 [Pontibacillus halophilus JSM 076056 = DSM 19796]|uniref:Uncharacterized protein n=1 Tax=Pontibacillus halophilus JSM 076056 = DSM 19796 TaxID=1385510 RepID=A0A0A5I6D6_9BACI|nr:hypothetical protein [Pontibacillus halophilus]KGX91392.1 hypothetical protein N781_04285 [Pontibacillus halophilus JSM 076056 = DSM 19796]